MLGDSRLNVYIQAAELSPRLRQRIQVQLETAFRAIPPWALGMLSARLDELGLRSALLMVEPMEGSSEARAMSCGEVDGRPAVRILPRVRGEVIEWGQDKRYLLAKAIGYLASPEPASTFWAHWHSAIETDALRHKALVEAGAWNVATDMDLFLEMFAAYALTPRHSRWRQFPAVLASLEAMRPADA